MPDENNARTAWIAVPSAGELPEEVASEIDDAAGPNAEYHQLGRTAVKEG